MGSKVITFSRQRPFSEWQQGQCGQNAEPLCSEGGGAPRVPPLRPRAPGKVYCLARAAAAETTPPPPPPPPADPNLNSKRTQTKGGEETSDSGGGRRAGGISLSVTAAVIVERHKEVQTGRVGLARSQRPGRRVTDTPEYHSLAPVPTLQNPAALSFPQPDRPYSHPPVPGSLPRGRLHPSALLTRTSHAVSFRSHQTNQSEAGLPILCSPARV